MDDLIAFLKTRLDEDEQTAHEATDGPWVDEFSGETGHCVIPADAMSTREYVAKTQLLAALPDARHIARHDPARVLAEVEAKRRLLDWLERTRSWATDNNLWTYDEAEALKLLALPYADHADYRDEWKP